MHVVVKFHQRSRPSLDAWLHRIVTTPPADPRLPAVIRDALVQLFIDNDGWPPGTTTLPGGPAPRNVCRSRLTPGSTSW
jgi:hypothetical protein